MDRLVRTLLAEICALVAFFWMGRDWQIVLYLLAFVLVFQAATAVCGFYSLVGKNTCERIKRKDKNIITTTIAIMVLIAVAGGYVSSSMTKDILKDDLASIENPYNLTLLSIEKNQGNESMAAYEQMNTSFIAFEKKYSNYRPMVIKFDEQFQGDVQNISIAVKSSRQDIYSGNLTKAQIKLKPIGPILRGIKKRNALE